MKYSLTYALFIVCVSSLEAVKFRCDYTYRGSGWYKYHEIPLPWRDARMMCYHEGAVLASPITANMKSEMKSLMPFPDIFLGFNAISKGQYYSVEGVPLSTIRREWAPMEPDNKNDTERCLSMSPDGKLSDVKCEEPRPYLCYRKDSDVDVNDCGTIDSGYKFERRTEKCYKFHSHPANFVDAHFACSAEGGQVVIINSDKEAAIIREMMDAHPRASIVGGFNKEYMHLGFVNWGHSPQTNWMTLEGQPIETAGLPEFAPGEPNNIETEPENCGSIHRNSGLLNDLPCTALVFNYICEKDPSHPPVCTKEQSYVMSQMSYEVPTSTVVYT
ncbi:macrophage mannose receptor 1-like [Anticarsia gemmatalis]|uniref:macrophage mannose receptor 1-like n=1 Tax=Anticarsia gemmatalis TaxID=129554 RepID=UPI003F75CF19